MRVGVGWVYWGERGEAVNESGGGMNGGGVGKRGVNGGGVGKRGVNGDRWETRLVWCGDVGG